MDEGQLRGLDRRPVSERDHELALRHAPVICFDAREPFLPTVVGYTVFRQSAASESFPRELELTGDIACAIEYAIWWDWDIQHLYELEHAWVYLDASGNLIAADASWHGRFNRMLAGDSRAAAARWPPAALLGTGASMPSRPRRNGCCSARR